MIKVTGTCNEAVVYTEELEESARVQIETMCSSEAFADSRIAIMPDVHAGAGCTIGTTMTLVDKVVPNMVGVDIGCGMETVRIAEKEIDFAEMDRVIRNGIPFGRAVRRQVHPNAQGIVLEELRCASQMRKLKDEYPAIGSLGGGNHFIEADRDEEGNLYLVIHSGSRHLGKMVAEYYQEQAYRQCCHLTSQQIEAMIAGMKEAGREQDIQEELQKRKMYPPVDRELAYCTGKLFEDYIHDMKIMQDYADLNRRTMMEILLTKLHLTPVERFTTVHNYIDTEARILRKGAVSARKGEKLLIPMNMKDGSLICIGKGNAEWNFSAPHGAGRICGRKEAKRRFSLEEFRRSMEGIYSTTVNAATLDECPMAYKSMDGIVRNIEPTAEIVSVIKPVYNFKAEE